jgi:FKBP-type peptidyl-prolyl cis-trans isomerase 2
MRYAPDQLVCESRQLFRIVLSRGDTIKPLEDAIGTMSVGEQARITIKADKINDDSTIYHN